MMRAIRSVAADLPRTQRASFAHPMMSHLRLLLCALILGLACGRIDAQAPTPTPTPLPTPALGEKKFAPPALFEHEVVSFINLLERYHYNRDNVRPAEFGQLVNDYMAEFDGQRLFFLQSDLDEFSKRYPPNWLYNNIASLGRIEPAFTIYSRFQQRAASRIEWLLTELKKPVVSEPTPTPTTEQALDLTVEGSYTVDRTKAPWPGTEAEADQLWQARLKYDLVQEILNKKTPQQARDDLAKRYERMLKNLGETESIELAEIFLSTIARLYDPHSVYFSPDTFEDFSIQMRLSLVGIGAVLGIEDDLCVVRELVAGGPADLSKQIMPNDRILAVAQGDGEAVDIVGMKLRKIVEMIRGNKGTKVKLLVQSGKDATKRKEIEIVRDVVNLNSARARGAIYEVPNPDGKSMRSIGVITLPTFYSPDSSADGADKNSASGDVARLIEQMKQAGIQGLVLDLRQNGGGFLHEAIDLVGLFIRKGPVVQVRNYYGNVDVDSDENDSVAYDGPLAVLVSRFSASASEIAAGALQNYGRAIVIGDSSTHGKGSVQQVVPMREANSPYARLSGKAGAVKFTIQKFYLPDGHSTQLKGVVPDIVLPSIDDFLPIGERDLPHALIWDEIESSKFDGRPIDGKLASSLRTLSQERQKQLPEFSYLQKSIDWYKTKQDQKTLSTNLIERRRQKEEDSAFRKQMTETRHALAAGNFPSKEFLLGPKNQANVKAAPEDGEDEEETEDESKRIDVHLREALRVVNDAVSLGDDHPSPAKPLTLAASEQATTKKVQ
ncbi:MAG: carboxy terminal-processing peptidase [Opitutaceae bacterium]|nr:carboxy terminal-processing peptidase [Opitutaceae bacterium]